MTGQQLWAAARHGHAAKVRTLLSTQGAQSFINYQDPNGTTPLHLAADRGHEAVAQELIAARCSVDLIRTRLGSRRSTARPVAGMRPSQRSSLLRAVTSTFELRKALLRCKLLSARGKLESPTLIRNRKQETPLLGSRVAINGLVAKPELNGRTGTVVSFDDAKGRYCLELEGTSSSLMIKPCNLLLTVCSVALCSLLFSHVQTLPRLS